MIVVGLGGVGSAAAYHLARCGLSVLGIDQHSPPHTRGSSHGQTRVIRQAYFEHPDYVPLLKQAYALWDALESETGQSLFQRTGLLQIGPADGVVIPGVLRSAREHELEIESMTMQQATMRFPGVTGDDSWSVVLEHNAGYLLVDRCVDAHLRQAEKLGATLLLDQKVIDWQSDANGVSARTGGGTFFAKNLVLCGGPWSSCWLHRMHVPLTVMRKHIYWYSAPMETYGQECGFPCYFLETPDGYFYGTPMRDDLGLKAARHRGGETLHGVDNDVHRQDSEDRAKVESFLTTYLPEVSSELRQWSGCYYTMTPDENFIVDRLPESPRVVVIAGLSGHGFKFTSVLGRVAADLVTENTIDDGLDFLKLSRFRKSESQISDDSDG